MRHQDNRSFFRERHSTRVPERSGNYNSFIKEKPEVSYQFRYYPRMRVFASFQANKASILCESYGTTKGRFARFEDSSVPSAVDRVPV